MTTAALPGGRPVRWGEAGMLAAGLVSLTLLLVVFVVLPLGAILVRSLYDRNDAFVGLANFAAFLQTPALTVSVWNSVAVSALTTTIVVPLAFAYAFAITRTAMPGKGLFKALAQIPILAPSLLPAIALVYLFGNKGVLRDLMMGHSIYGPIGIVIGEVFYTFPHAVMILTVALSTADARLYEAAEALGAGRLRRFLTITLPGARYGLISAVFVVFTLVITDFGVPKVIGGSFNVLATDVYKQVVGQQNFGMGAVVGMVLLVPAVLAFVADWIGQKRQMALLSARSVPYAPRRRPAGDGLALLFCALVAGLLLGILGMAGFASLATFWPYDLTPTLANYDFAQFDSAGWSSYWNSLRLSVWTAVVGTAVVFVGAWLIERSPAARPLAAVARMAAIVPLAVPGMVLGLAYIFFFNAPWNPLGWLYHGMAILVLSTVVHFYTVSHLTAVTALKQLDREFEAVSASLKVPVWTTFLRVTVPLCLPAILDIAIYFFVNAMTTVSAVVFLYAPATKPASVAVLNMDDAGEVAGAAAMAMMIVYTSAGVRALHAVLSWVLQRRTQAWRAR
ncbi:putative 2-aminoethylphosphonate ABC transporter permease subunit [Azospirillum sp. RWY-5-1]|uniref:2-aminoethylphosphonate ABC transporter permease subunit n=1 Tax=Azospirillum oleiclasticum TaxID=2735135 RepID=A0ABX2TM48_9PROT|nr:putative 2-aminoethylphosphonate ABC transporter permease subunit [Azospirillum oleiclasticum]NYZ17622.1 putative 2-aminoethylphosphonate ABC transporter permease subunit [Azospirillum oleiclasticum]NYZ24910.1 putative 2-aminoethylphosphonate ABC transporter permease subunit [Azospirillum oleiclasticum]